MNMSGMGIGMWIFWIIVVLAVVLAVVLVAKLMIVGSSNQSRNQSSIISASPLDILKKRYASGEINQEEFESMKKELEK